MFNNFDFWTPGFKVNTIEKLLEIIPLCFKEDFPYKNEIEKKFELWFGNREDGGCKEICDYIFNENGINEHLQIYKSEEDVLQEALQLKDKELVDLDNKLIDLQHSLTQNQVDLDKSKKELENIYNSRSWKAVMLIQKTKRGLSNIIHGKKKIDDE